MLDAGGSLFLVAILGAAGLIAIPIIFVIEAAVMLALLKRHPRRKTWLTVIAANAASYVVMFVFYMVMQSGIIRF